MKWQEMTAIYVIGNQHPVATFINESQAETWAQSQFPGEWIKKPIKIPHRPLASKTSQKNLKNIAATLAQMDWCCEEIMDDEELVRGL